MEMTSLIIVGVVVLVAIITIIGILSRYRKCKSDELLVVYGKTGSHKEKVSERDAKGTKKKLLAEAEQKQAMEMAPALAVEHMIKSGMHPEAIVQYAMTDRWKEVAEGV